MELLESHVVVHLYNASKVLIKIIFSSSKPHILIHKQKVI